MFNSAHNFFKKTSIILLFSGFLFSIVNVEAQTITSTSTVTITAIVPAPPETPPVAPPNSGGGGGGGGALYPIPLSQDSVIFKGLAYPASIVSLLKNGKIVAELPASPDGTFEIHLQSLSAGTYSFGVMAEDSEHRKSSLDIYTVFISSGVTTLVDGLFIPPTITTDKTEVKRGDPLTILGRSAPNANITISIHSSIELVKKTKSASSGAYLYKLDSQELEYGDHESKARGITQTDLSLYSDIINFKVGTTNISRINKEITSVGKSDLNNDGRVNIIDFSIMAFWYKKTGFPTMTDLNNDGKIDLIDFSILAYHWTG